MKKFLKIFLAAIVVLCFASSFCFVVTEEDEYSLIRQFGKIDHVETEAGVSFKIPFLQSVEKLPNKTLIYDLTPSDVITADKKTMISDSYILWHISDPLKFAQTLNSSVSNAENRLDTIVYNATNLLKGLPPLAAAIGMVILISFINGLIPSGSGKGALLSPIIIPIAMELGLTSQTSVLAYQFGDGITNMFWFSYGTLMIFLNYAKVPVNKWYKFFVPLMVIYFLLSFVTLGIAIAIGF